MRQSFGTLAATLLLFGSLAACGGKVVDDPVGHAAAGSENAVSGGAASSDNGSTSNTSACTMVSAGGGGMAGGACIEIQESASCDATTYSVQCTCPGPCACIVNGETVDTAPTSSCSKPVCPLPDDAWKACGFPAVPDMP